MGIAGTACLVTEMHDDDGTILTNGKGSGSAASVALVVPTPRDHNLEYMVGLTSMAVVIVPSLRRKRRDDAARTT
jgi:hypothetical protein